MLLGILISCKAISKANGVLAGCHNGAIIIAAQTAFFCAPRRKKKDQVIPLQHRFLPRFDGYWPYIRAYPSSGAL